MRKNLRRNAVEYGCKGKFQFKSKKLALVVARRASKKAGAYFCENCKFYHVGSRLA